mmetsp:Transcript_114785/g.222970  ORF Transcript_114785/g.222970 Transcript_114785/m.222970 type:complete len:83 (+) Transcript_114785:21-269(+)
MIHIFGQASNNLDMIFSETSTLKNTSVGCSSGFDPNTKSHASHARPKELRLLRSYALRIIQFLTLYICSLSSIYSTICNAHA